MAWMKKEKRGVLVKYFSVIYEIVDALKAVMAGKLPPIQKRSSNWTC